MGSDIALRSRYEPVELDNFRIAVKLKVILIQYHYFSIMSIFCSFQPNTLLKIPICSTETKSTGPYLQKPFNTFHHRLSVTGIIFLFTPSLNFLVCEFIISWQRHRRVFRYYCFTFKFVWVLNTESSLRENLLWHLVITSEYKSLNKT